MVQIEFDFDVGTFPTIALDSDSYNTRRLSEVHGLVFGGVSSLRAADDVDFEFDLQYRSHIPSSTKQQPTLRPVADMRAPTIWPDVFTEAIQPSDLPELVLTAAKTAGAKGITQWSLQVCLRIVSPGAAAPLPQIGC